MAFDHVTLNILLRDCRPNRDHDLAIQALGRVFQQQVRPQQDAYDSLFRQFWTSKHFNCAKVLWRYACIEGQTTFRMRRFVHLNITDTERGLSAEPGTRNHFWKQCAGKVLVGISPSIDLESKKQLVRYIDGSEIAPSPNIVYLKWYQDDLGSAHRHETVSNVKEMLSQALAIDRQWAVERIWRDRTLEWVQRESIIVQLKQNYPARFLAQDRSKADLCLPSPSRGQIESTRH